ncbi:MAG: hypothetical protein IJD81_03740 [Oscillospiraceae bacterium]|nr:hypothetical protein [Oscillospiraceae bacterium]
MHFHKFKKTMCLALAGVMVASMTGCTLIEQVKDFIGLGRDEVVTPDPKPQITVEYGSADPVTLDLQEGVPTSYLKPGNFSITEDGRFTYTTQDGGEVLTGIDVSEHQLYPDWDKVAADGIDFAMIRMGYRGSTEGMLYKDPIFRYNLTKATNAGLKVGVYFFSQATCRAEAVAEAYYVTAVLEEFKDKITMPVVFDWEETGNENSRTKGLDGKTVSDCAMYFTDVIREAGYQPGVYFNRHMGYYLYNLAQLPDVTFWFAGEGDYSDFYYEHSIWQYTFTGKVDGINGDVDINLYVAPPKDDIPDDTTPVFDENGTVDGELYSPSGD